jgi:hypothetical protein
MIRTLYEQSSNHKQADKNVATTKDKNEEDPCLLQKKEKEAKSKN